MILKMRCETANLGWSNLESVVLIKDPDGIIPQQIPVKLGEDANRVAAPQQTKHSNSDTGLGSGIARHRGEL
jgi:hypothetical protein